MYNVDFNVKQKDMRAEGCALTRKVSGSTRLRCGNVLEYCTVLYMLYCMYLLYSTYIHIDRFAQLEFRVSDAWHAKP